MLEAGQSFPRDGGIVFGHIPGKIVGDDGFTDGGGRLRGGLSRGSSLLRSPSSSFAPNNRNNASLIGQDR